ncbi:PIN-like domain-containing protein [Psychrobacter sp. Ps7]|jgi:hypothetical protein|uniref:PIN-like domain-containing protein n=1 Tax=Psychrobacter sp. Ps7 TaxID=2790961 RepID=UPI001EDD2F1A|nr:PIN-like domain-containing protein [Psychrobacter sp. Ps7]MCG3873578.1 hypothetical protein [Psychrobacter sp. Ps7]
MQMQELFKGYYSLTEQDLNELWKNAVFVFDTNVLLNLYRYQSSTRDSLIKVIEGFSERVWIPYYVGLEFQNNRLNVISKQYNRYSELEDIVSKSVTDMQTKVNNLQLKKRHSNIDPDKLIEIIESFKSNMSTEIDGFKEMSMDINSLDTIREKIDELFYGKIGKAPKNQEEIDKITKEGAIRYKYRIPPGFRDNKKDLNEDESSHNKHENVYYERKYGDLIIWKQIIKHAKESGLTDIIFITDDNKSDWWLKKSGKTIGARPELINEITEEANVERFHMYTMENFLSYANEKMGAKVEEEVIQEVRNISSNNNLEKHSNNGSIEDIVQNYLLQRFETVVAESEDYVFDYIVSNGNLKNGIVVKDLRLTENIKNSIIDNIERIKNSIYNASLEMVYVICILEKSQYTEELFWLFRHTSMRYHNIKILAGSVEYNRDNSRFLQILSNYK